ncbi:MAG: hypothetical protein AB7Q27_29155, partial [Acidimicrobiia bacterium]
RYVRPTHDDTRAVNRLHTPIREAKADLVEILASEHPRRTRRATVRIAMEGERVARPGDYVIA